MSDVKSRMLLLAVRNVPPDTPPLDATVAYADTEPGAEGKLAVTTHVSTVGRDLLRLCSGNNSHHCPDDPAWEHLVFNRYELLDGERARRDVEYAFLTINVDPLDDGRMRVTYGTPDWLAESARNAGFAIMNLLFDAVKPDLADLPEPDMPDGK